MKNLKRFLSLLCAIAMCIGMSGMTTFAAETLENTSEGSEFVLPDDAVILYQDDEVVLYQSHEEVDSDIMPLTDNNYGYAWLDVGAKPDLFKVYNTHTSKLGVTWKIETSSSTDYAQIWMTNPNGITVLTTRSVYTSDGDVHLTVAQGVKGYYSVHYIPVRLTTGMRILCWTYDA